MKVVLFCGGFGMRMRDYAENIPKALVPIGNRPIIWHLMKIYASYGFNDFILCLGYKAAELKQYFLNYDERLNNDFVYWDGGAKIQLVNQDIQEWKITFVDTGLHTNIGGRLLAVKHLLQDDEMFMANYADGLSDVPLDKYVAHFQSRDEAGMLLSLGPPHIFHVVTSDNDNVVTDISYMSKAGLHINGGYFVFRNTIFDRLRPGEELVEEPFQRLIAERELISYPYDGFWSSVDTYKDRARLDDLYVRGEAPWTVWEKNRG